MNELKIIGSVFIAVFLAVLLALFISSYGNPVNLGGGEMFPITNMATSGVISISTSNARNELLIATNTQRTYLGITNDCTSPVYLSFNNKQTFIGNVLASGLRLNASGGSFEVTQNNRYTGAVRASSTANCKVSVTEGR